jgi:FAD/FMN-containing dehydrogenase
VPSPWIVAERRRVSNIDEYLAALKDAAARWPMTMGWIDCLSQGDRLGRGILLAGRWATREEAPSHFPKPVLRLPVPVLCPSWVMGSTVGRIFNAGYYAVNSPKPPHVVHPEQFFYPLDMLLNWNLLYGKRGFTQHQCVIPETAGPQAVRRFLDLLSGLGAASFLCVIKDCGDEGDGLLSFPMRGTSVALDMPVRDDTQHVVDTLNEYVISVGGRIYLAKDAFTRAEHFRAMEPRLEAFNAVRRKWDPEGRLRSAQSVRLFGDRA